MAMVGGFSVLPGMNGEALAACSDYVNPTPCKNAEEGCHWGGCIGDAGCNIYWEDENGCIDDDDLYDCTWQGCVAGSGATYDAPTLDVINAIQTATNWIFYILILISVIYLILGGIGYVTAQGDIEKVKASGQKVMWALIGVVVAILARGLVNLVSKAIGGGSYY